MTNSFWASSRRPENQQRMKAEAGGSSGNEDKGSKERLPQALGYGNASSTATTLLARIQSRP